jgi:hypothetical protein
MEHFLPFVPLNVTVDESDITIPLGSVQLIAYTVLFVDGVIENDPLAGVGELISVPGTPTEPIKLPLELYLLIIFVV